MIIRIVKMSFRHDAAEAFQAVFTKHSQKYRVSPAAMG
jgi:hypothetical protein